MKTLTILFFVSVAMNACFFAGSKTLHDAVYGSPCKYAQPSPPPARQQSELIRIAELLDIKTSGKSSSDLESDICYKLERSRVDVPTSFDPVAFEKMAKDLNSSEEKVMRDYQRFISDLQGKRVIVIEPEQ